MSHGLHFSASKNLMKDLCSRLHNWLTTNFKYLQNKCFCKIETIIPNNAEFIFKEKNAEEKIFCLKKKSANLSYGTSIYNIFLLNQKSPLIYWKASYIYVPLQSKNMSLINSLNETRIITRRRFSGCLQYHKNPDVPKKKIKIRFSALYSILSS